MFRAHLMPFPGVYHAFACVPGTQKFFLPLSFWVSPAAAAGLVVAADVQSRQPWNNIPSEFVKGIFSTHNYYVKFKDSETTAFLRGKCHYRCTAGSIVQSDRGVPK
jgi:hypothetical protein